MARTRRRNEEITSKNYGGATPWLTPQEDAEHSLEHKINKRKKNIMPLQSYAGPRNHGRQHEQDC